MTRLINRRFRRCSSRHTNVAIFDRKNSRYTSEVKDDNSQRVFICLYMFLAVSLVPLLGFLFYIVISLVWSIKQVYQSTKIHKHGLSSLGVVMATQWGIVGVGKIAADFTACIQSLSPDSHKIVAVASRSIDRALKFADEHSIAQGYGSYCELSQDSNVEVAYICTDHYAHFDCAKMMLENGKHVLCEKPMCTSVKQTEELIQLAKANNKFLMEGVWSRFFPAYSHVQQLLNDNVAGKAVQVHAHFGLQSFLVDRTLREGKEFSLTLDIGVYVLQICNLVFKNTKPKVLVASGSFNATGADDNVVMLLDYGQGRSANVTISWKCFMENSAIICCDKSYIKVLPPFHCPTQIEVNGNIIEFPLPKIDHMFNYENSAGFVYEIEEVRRCLQNGLLESPAITLQESYDLATILEDVRKRIGIIRY